jgi:chromosome segregation ATPase
MVEQTKDPITFGEVCDAIDDIIARGENPTIARVRVELGDRGSNTTITKYINAWKDNYEEKLPIQASPIRKLASDNVHQLVDKIWEQLQQESKATNEKIKQEAQTAIENVNKEKEKIDQERAELVSTLDRLNKEMTELETNNRKLDQSLIQEQQENKVLQARLKDAQKLYDTMIKQKSEIIEKGNQSNKDLSERLEKLRAQKTKEIDELRSIMEDQRHKHITELEAKKSEVNKLDKQCQKLEMLQQKLQDSNNEYKTEITRFKQQLKEKEAKQEKLLSDNSKLQKEVVKTEAKNEHCEKQHNELTKKYDAFLNKNQQETKKYEERVGRLEEQIKQLKENHSGGKKSKK